MSDRLQVSVSCDVADSFEVSAVRGLFDLPETESVSETFEVDRPPDHSDDDWKIGVIVGPSGSGKSTVAGDVYGDALVRNFDWDPHAAVITQVGGESTKHAARILAAVGFSSPPSWVKPYHVLSGGERFRCDLARALLSPDREEHGNLIAFDEYTSVVDRTVAQVGSAAIAKAIRAEHVDKRFVAVTCHYDVLDWLEPDWVLDMASCQLARGCLHQRPPIELRVHRTTHRAWELFRRHHYLSSNLNKLAKCFVATIDGRPAGFIAVIHYPHPSGMYWREHRTVVLPDFQGIGIGNRLSELVASAFAATGHKYFVSTLHPSHTYHRAKSPLWKVTQKPSRAKRARTSSKRGSRLAVGNTTATTRLKMSFKYVGPADPELARQFGIVSG
jgi:GNAT superfamily N-acetyltransferase/ABC-type uncharacterized transport system YnjBCD ATPase subunit